MRALKVPFWVPSLFETLLALLFLKLLFVHPTLLKDLDTCFHIRLGEYMIRTGTIPHHDIFVLDAPDATPWIMHSWLTQIMMGAFHLAFGLNGIVLLFASLICIIFTCLYLRIQKDSNALMAAVMTAICAALCSYQFVSRPFIVSMFLTVIWHGILEDFQYRDKHRLFLLPLLMLAWVNFHSQYVIGFILLGAYLLGNLVAMWIYPNEKQSSFYRVKILCVVLLMSFVVSLFNPDGFQSWIYLFQSIFDQPLRTFVSEMRPPIWMGSDWFYAYQVGLWGTFLFSPNEKRNLFFLILVSGFSFIGLSISRNMSFCVLVTAPILASKLHRFYLSRNISGWWKERFERIQAIDQSCKKGFWFTTVFLSVIIVMSLGKINFNFDAKQVPKEALKYVKEHNIKGRVFNDDDFGDYMIYALWPQRKVMFYGQTNIGKRLSDGMTVQGAKHGWRDVLRAYKAEWLLMDVKTKGAKALKNEKSWREIYRDDVAVIFLKS